MHITRHFIHYQIHLQLGLIKLIDLIVVWYRAQDRSEEFFLSFHSSSYLFSDCPIELGIGLIELRIGLIELRVGLIELGIGLRIHILLGIGLIELGIGLMELGIGLIELGIGLRFNNARRTVWFPHSLKYWVCTISNSSEVRGATKVYMAFFPHPNYELAQIACPSFFSKSKSNLCAFFPLNHCGSLWT